MNVERRNFVMRYDIILHSALLVLSLKNLGNLVRLANQTHSSSERMGFATGAIVCALFVALALSNLIRIVGDQMKSSRRTVR
jgi:hypothetical protein